MPGRDGSGPTGQGSMSGRGLGVCSGLGRGTRRFFGTGFFCKRVQGFRRNINLALITSKTQNEIQIEQKRLLQKELDLVNQQLEDSKKD